MFNNIRAWTPFVILLSAVLLSACAALERESMTETIERKGASTAQIQIGMGAGTLDIRSENMKSLAKGDFSYNKQNKPEIDYQVNGDNGMLSIQQPKDEEAKTDLEILKLNQWTLSLNDQVPLDLQVDAGAANTHLDLRNLSLQSLTVNMGVGKNTVDLSGDWKEGFQGELNSGVGLTEVILPKDVSVRIKADGIRGTFTEDFYKQDGYYVNDAYGKSDIQLEIICNIGIGGMSFKTR